MRAPAPWLTALFAAVLSLLAAGCGRTRSSAPIGDGPPRLLVISSTIGYIEPCGCTIDLTLGGIDRITSVVRAERAHGPTAVLLVGPHFFEKAPEAHRAAQEEAKARLIARSFAHIGVDVVVPTAIDLAGGEPLYRELRQTFSAPDVTANVPGGQGRVLTVGDVRVGIFGLAAPGASTPGGAPTDPREAAAAEAARLRAEGATVVVALAALPRRDLRRMARGVEGIDLWVLGDHPEEAPLASPLGHGYLIEAGDRGRNVGRIVLHDAAAPGPLADPVGDADRQQKALELQIKMKSDLFERSGDAALGAEVARLKAEQTAAASPVEGGKRFAYTLLPVVKEIAPDATVAGWLAEYNASLKAINLAHAGTVPPVPPGKSTYVGDAICKDCHPEAFALWESTPHGKAWQTLVDAGKTFDAECVGCHVTGWQKPGGTVLGNTRELVNVGCEVCHGPSSRHVEYGGDEHYIERESPEALCVECHNEHHSPRFDYATYLPQVLGPGHRALEPWRPTGGNPPAPAAVTPAP